MPISIASNFDLSNSNTLGLPSSAEFYCACSNLEELQQALAWARKNKQSVSVLAGGSNTLLKERISGLVLQPSFKGIEATIVDEDKVGLSVGAGEVWHELVRMSVVNEWNGLENLALIPGSVGAAPIQNIGAYGVEVSEIITSVDTVDLNTGELRQFQNKECCFAYRDSIFKHEYGAAHLIYQVHFILKRKFAPVLEYPALKNAFAQTLPESALQVADAVEALRSEKLPDPNVIPNAGSFFKNPIISRSAYLKLKETYEHIVAFDAGTEHHKLAAAWLIDQCGWKNRSLNGVRVHESQALVVVNPERKSVDVVMALAAEIQASVRSKFGISLETEPQFLQAITLDDRA